VLDTGEYQVPGAGKCSSGSIFSLGKGVGNAAPQMKMKLFASATNFADPTAALRVPIEWVWGGRAARNKAHGPIYYRNVIIIIYHPA